MRDYSIDLATEQIHSRKTKAYFEEVASSYNNRNYRSAVVMLYSVVICDLIFKLEELRDRYGDKKATKILVEIKKMQEDNPTSADWENSLVKLVKERTNLLEASDQANIMALKNHRHLSAHPVLSEGSELFSPNKDTTRAHIRSALEGILTKSALLSNDIVGTILADLADLKNLIFDDKKLSIHLEEKYLKSMPVPLINRVFVALWKMCFVSDSEVCHENREINVRALEIFLEKYYSEHHFPY